jgi:hypothetical protein
MGHSDAVVQLVLLIDKYKQLEKDSLSATQHKFAKEVVQDLETLKDVILRR